MSIVFDHLSFSYENSKSIFADFSASFSSEKITVLTGVSGCGKSTLLYLAAGLYPQNAGEITAGSVIVNGSGISHLAPKERCRHIGMMFQNPELQFCMDTVRNELVFCLENIGFSPDDSEGRINYALEFCEILHLKERTLLSLSGGEKQKVMLACMVALNPKWILLDEPFANIDNTSAAIIAEKLRKLHDEFGTGILAVDHRLDNWIEVADEVAVFADGKILPERMQVKKLDKEKLLTFGIIVPGESYKPSLLPKEEGEISLEIENLSLYYGDKKVLDNVNALFRYGMIYAVTGESGCGKSSLFKAVSGERKCKGAIKINGKRIKNSKIKIGFVTQNPQDQFVSDTVEEEILTSIRKEESAKEKAREILKNIKLWRYREASPYILSQGQQRRLGTAALTAYDCRVLICDEPTYAQDRSNTVAIMDTLCRQAREKNITLIFSTHDMQLAKDYADVIFEISEGKMYEKN